MPFAEFFPVPDFVRSWLRLMSLPYSDFTRGGSRAAAAARGGLKLATTICYEDAYGSSQLAVLREADALVNVTNDAWFGHGTARHQHFQIARMRAIEAQRFMLRAANDGISAVIGPRGEVVARGAGIQALRAAVARDAAHGPAALRPCRELAGRRARHRWRWRCCGCGVNRRNPALRSDR